MVELIGLSIVLLVVVLGLFFAIPRIVGTEGEGSLLQREAGWPDLFDASEAVVQRWQQFPRALDAIAAVAAIVIVLAGVELTLGVGMFGLEGEGILEGVGLLFIVLGLALLAGFTYVGVRRGGLSSAESSLVGMSLSGTVLIVLILYVLVAQS